MAIVIERTPLLLAMLFVWDGGWGAIVCDLDAQVDGFSTIDVGRGECRNENDGLW